VPDLTLQAIFFRLVALALVAILQGATVAAVAVALGDRGPRHDGRLTLWPAGHVDLLGAIGFVLFGLGWAKPVRIDPEALRAGRAALVLPALAASSVLAAAAFALAALASPALTVLPLATGLWAAAFLRVAAALCLANAVFSLLPVPPLPGAHLLRSAGMRLPRAAAQGGGVALLVLLAVGFVSGVLGPAIGRLVAVLGPGI
jgi:Zn-dependent protease